MITETLHCGDNLEYMRSLPSESIDLIYSDILYGTGRNFGDYQDIKADRKTVEAFYIPRITEMHRLLKKTGSIYLQMDTRINHYVRLILEDIFGVGNFLNEITVKKRSSGNNTPTNYFIKNSDRILYYKKDKNYIFYNQYRNLSNEGANRFNLIDEDGRSYRTSQLINNGYNKNRTLLFNGKTYTGCYRWTQKTLDIRIKQGIKVVENSKGHLSYIHYLDENKGVQLCDIWTDATYAENLKSYKTQKPLALMERIIKASSNEGDTIADFFCGSGSFGVAGKKLNRNIILNDINPNAIEISKKRLNEVTDLFNSK